MQVLEHAPACRQVIGWPIRFGTASERLAPRREPVFEDVCLSLMTERLDLASTMLRAIAELLEWMFFTHAEEEDAEPFQCPVCLTSYESPIGHFASHEHLAEFARILDAGRDLFADPSVLYTSRIMGGFAEFHPVTNQYRVLLDQHYDTTTRMPRQLALLNRYPWNQVIFGPSQDRCHT